MVNKEIFVMMIFFAGVVTFLGLILSTGLTVNNPNTVTFSAGNESVINPSFTNQQGATCTNITSIPIGSGSSTTNNPILNFFGTIQQGFNSIATTFFNGFSTIDNLITNGVINPPGIVVTPSSTILSSNGQCGLNQQASSNLAAFQASGVIPQRLTPVTSLSLLVTTSLLIAGIFVGLGLLAGALGAGSLANIVTASGIGLSLIFFMQQVLGSVYFAGIPFVMQIFLTGITGIFFIWIVITLLRD